MAILTVTQLIRQARMKLDELPSEQNFWSNTELLEYLNEGLEEVWQTVREAQEDWFVRTIQSTDDSFYINGQEYDPANLAVLSDRAANLLPSDFDQLLLFEELPSSEGTRLGASFLFQKQNSPGFRDLWGVAATTGGLEYYISIERRTGGAYLVFSPTPRPTSTVPVVLKYIMQAPALGIGDTFETAALTLPMLSAVKAFIHLRAVEKLEDNDYIARAQNRWEQKKLLALRSAGPNQTRDPVVVLGFMEDELMEEW